MLEKNAWNRFVLEHGPRSGRFLQSWEWGECQQAMGETVRREVYEEQGKVAGVGQWIDRKVPLFGGYRFCPKGPIGPMRLTSDQMFLRVEPQTDEFLSHAKKSIDVNPAHTLITDLRQSEDELLAHMHEKTRYNIRVATRHELVIDLHHGSLDDVWPLFRETSQRGSFRLHIKQYYESMLQNLQGSSCSVFCAVAQTSGAPLAATIMVDFGDTRTYLHGASSNGHRNFMAPYLLHWELMRDAKSCGQRFYDWWGVAPQSAPPNHPWTGISRFKRGFGGEEVASPGTYDIVHQPFRYQLYSLSRAFARTIRHL
ncbi:peptidoglycan bridge formation glycyltransferase FemA/FemB family protein [Candidatus Uhrbacteria bacterium]|nr:peptidoglycan bridge formation glycyltransferase FemA/FemB family protein [Candidatus Uhrbacteria bacterium]